MHRLVSLLILTSLILNCAVGADRGEGAVSDLLKQARAASRNGKNEEAIVFATKAIEADPKNSNSYYIRGQFYETTRQHAKAIADYDQVLQFDPRAPEGYQHRGCEHFKLGHIADSIADFDKFIELIPRQAPYHWQRGISLYYAGRYDDGRKQFELHQTVNPNDVENAVWHFLCVARSTGVEKARSSLIPIKGDARVPMAEIHALFSGKSKPEDVVAAAKAGESPSAALNNRLFYAHLYLGLYYEVIGDESREREYIFKAAERSQENDYMGDVARVHADLLR
ncbi:MAG: tetratricopeptide repeat protein, partial [Verrucomicrobiota bacterium]